MEYERKGEQSKREEFKELVDPVIKWINENYHPHVTIVITPNTAELLEGTIGYTTAEHIKD